MTQENKQYQVFKNKTEIVRVDPKALAKFNQAFEMMEAMTPGPEPVLEQRRYSAWDYLLSGPRGQ